MMKYFMPVHFASIESNTGLHESQLLSVRENISHVRKVDPGAIIYLYNNGHLPEAAIDADYFETSTDWHSTHPSTGEALMLRAFLSKTPGSFIKTHARCKVKNLACFINHGKSNLFFFNRNIRAFSRPLSHSTLPYIDTRFFKADSSELGSVLNMAFELVLDRKVNLEQAFMYAFYANPEICSCLVSRYRNYPIFSGVSGHGKDYSSFKGTAMQFIKSYAYRFGFS